MSNIITNPYFALAMQATRGKTARARRAGIAGLIDLHAATTCKWTAASAGSDLVDFHGVRLTWNETTLTYEAEPCPKMQRNIYCRREPAEVVPLAALRARHEQSCDAAHRGGASPPAA